MDESPGLLVRFGITCNLIVVCLFTSSTETTYKVAMCLIPSVLRMLLGHDESANNNAATGV